MNANVKYRQATRSRITSAIVIPDRDPHMWTVRITERDPVTKTTTKRYERGMTLQNANARVEELLGQAS